MLTDKLAVLDGFINNEYLQKYCLLIERNRHTKNFKGTNKHHIIPKCWFKLHGEEIDNTTNNLVTLSYRDHVLAHYFLCLCTIDKLQYANQLALMCLTTRKKLNIVEKQLIARLPLYNNIYESCKQRQHDSYKLYEEN